MYLNAPFLILLSAVLHAVDALPGRATPRGAAYVISNDGSQNTILAHNIGADGKVAFSCATSAGGRGLHGNTTDPMASDGLFSQGVIKVSGDFVYTVNPGSNTAAMFAINAKNPSELKMVGFPVSTGGEFPMSVAISPRGPVCVLNGGAVANVNCFKSDKKLGLITMENSIRMLSINQTTPPSGPAGSASHILFNEAGDILFAAIKGVPPQPGFIASWDVAEDGTLSQNFTKNTPGGGALLPFGMSNIPNSKAILDTDAAIGAVIYDFSKSPATTKVLPIAGQGATCWTSFSNATKSFFLTDAATSIVTEVAVDSQLNGSIVKQYPQTNGSATLDTAIGSINGKDFLYILSAGRTSIDVLTLPSRGGAKNIQDFNIAKAAKGIAVSAANIQGMAVYIKP